MKSTFHVGLLVFVLGLLPAGPVSWAQVWARPPIWRDHHGSLGRGTGQMPRLR